MIFQIRKKWEWKILQIHEWIKEEDVSKCLDLCKIEWILKKRPRTISSKKYYKCIKDFDELYIIEVWSDI